MNHKTSRREILRFLPVLGSTCHLLLRAGEGKPRVAVLDFDHAKVVGHGGSLVGNDAGYGRSIAGRVMAQLSQAGTFSVIDRALTHKMMDEQNFSNSDRADLNAAAKIGKLLSAEAFLLGGIEQLSYEPPKAPTSIPGCKFARLSKWCDMVTTGTKEVQRQIETVTTTLSFRLVSVDTSAVLTAGQAQGASQRTHYGNSALASSNERQQMAAEATDQAITHIVNTLRSAGAPLLATPRPLGGKASGTVLAVDGSVVVVSLGRQNGIQPGCRLEVRRPGKQVCDDRGQVIYTTSSIIGAIKIRDVQELGAEGVFEGTVTPQPRDIVEFDPTR